MKKSVIIILTLLSIALLMIGLKLSDQSITKDPGTTKDQSITKDQGNWELVKTVPLKDFIGDSFEFKLKTKSNPYSLILKDKNGNVLWTKTNLERYSNMIICDDSDIDLFGDINESDNEASKDLHKEASKPEPEKDSDEDFPYDGEFPDNRIALWGTEFIDGKGNCLLTDRMNSSFVFVDITGKEMYLPIKSDNWAFVGMALDKYLVFTITMDSKIKKQCAIFNKQGTKIKQFYLPQRENGWPEQVYMDDNADYLAYNHGTDPEGYTLLSTNGQVVRSQSKSSSGIWVYEPAFSADGNLWIPATLEEENFQVLDIKTGGVVYTHKGAYGCQAAISNRATGYLITTNGVGVQVLDYLNNKVIYKQNNDNAEFREPWISGDGKEIRFVYQEKGKHSELRYYRMK